MNSSPAVASGSNNSKVIDLRSALKAWADAETNDWDAAVAGPGGDDCDLWADLPAIDSKAVARTSPIFEKLLGRKLNIRLIRPGGYRDADDMIQDLLPRVLRGDSKRGKT